MTIIVEHKKSSVVMVFNDAGELLLQLRAAHDDTFPSYWDFPAGGGIDPGEDSKNSAERELQEELGVTADIEFITKGQYTYPARAPSVTREVDLFIYKAHHNGPFNPDPAEIEKVQFFTLAKIKEMIEAGEKFHPEFALSWDKGIILKAANNESLLK